MLVLSHNAAFAGRTRKYTTPTAALVDWVESSPEYRAINAAFAQTPRPEWVKVGRANDVSVTMLYELSLEAVNSYEYEVIVGGQGFDDETLTITADSATTEAELHNALLTALNAVTDKNYTTTFKVLTGVSDGEFTTTHGTETINKVAHGLNTGDGPVQVSNSGGALPAGLAALTDYYVVRDSADALRFATTRTLALAGTPDVLLTGDGTGTHTLDILSTTLSPTSGVLLTGNAAGAWFFVAPARELLMLEMAEVATTHVVSGLATVLTAISVADGDWYDLQILYPSKDYVVDAATWLESNNRVMTAALNDTSIINVAEGAGSDVAQALLDLAVKNTMVAYHWHPGQFMDAAWMGRWLPTTVGKATTKFKQLVLVTGNSLNDTQRSNLKDKRANSFEDFGGVAITFEGTVPSTVNKFFDITRGTHWIADTVRVRVYSKLINNDSLPFTPAGMQALQGGVDEMFAEGVDNSLFADDPAPTSTIPDEEDIDPTDKEDRILRSITGQAVFASSIHTAYADITVSF